MLPSALPGFRDFYPAECAERSHIFQAWREVARRFAFIEYDGPPLEPLGLYTKKSGDEIVGQLYTFEDRGGRHVALRPEMTPTLARMVAARANALRKPVRWFSIPQLFRYERQQRGRLREHFQLNLDILGETDVTADAELLAASLGIMSELGLTKDDVRARISDRRLLNGLLELAGVSREQLPIVYAVVDKLGRDPRAVLEERLGAAGCSDLIVARIFEVLKHTDLDMLRSEFHSVATLREDFTRLARYFEILDALGVRDWVVFDLSIVRGLAYYTGIVFELFDARGELRAIAGGGRYDNLLSQLGGSEMPALGFGMGDVVLGELLRARNLMPRQAEVLDYWVAGADGASETIVIQVATALRRRKLRVEYPLRAQKLPKQIKAAAAAGAAKVLIIHDDRTATVRRLADGHEESVSLPDLFEGAGGSASDPWIFASAR